MQPATIADVTAAARYLWSCSAKTRRDELEVMLLEAELANLYRLSMGRAHPRLGDGSLMAAALTRKRVAEPPLSDATYCRCLAQVLEALARRAA